MKELAVYEAKTRLSELLAEVERGEEFLITRRGIPVARLVGAAPAAASRRARANAQRQGVAQALDELSLLSRGVSLDLPLRQAVEAGRD